MRRYPDPQPPNMRRATPTLASAPSIDSVDLTPQPHPPRLSFLVSGTPSDAFFSQIAFFRICMDALGGHYRTARLIAVLGGTKRVVVPPRWKPHFERIDLEWAPFPGPEELGTVFDDTRFHIPSDMRFHLIPDDTDVAILCDADVALLRRFDSLIDRLLNRPALAGVIAHNHYVWDHEDPSGDWRQLSQQVLGSSIETPHHYTLVDPHGEPQAPFYVNYGVLFAPPEILRSFIARDLAIRPVTNELAGPFFGAQVSLALTCEHESVPTMVLPMRYNFPNDPIADARYSDELDRMVFLHYLRTVEFDRHQIFATESHFERFLSLELTGSNLVFQQFVQKLTDGAYPFSA